MDKVNRAIFLDRDGTIIDDCDYLKDPSQINFISGSIEALKIFQSLNYLLVIVTNQSGVARGFFTEKDVKKIHNSLLYRLKKENIEIAGVYYCPHYSGGFGNYGIECDCRKPSTGMLMKASEDLHIDLSLSILAGDKTSDLQAAHNAKLARYYLVKTGKGAIEEKKVNKFLKPIVCNDLLEVAILEKKSSCCC